jgi:hypothetical protein
MLVSGGQPALSGVARAPRRNSSSISPASFTFASRLVMHARRHSKRSLSICARSLSWAIARLPFSDQAAQELSHPVEHDEMPHVIAHQRVQRHRRKICLAGALGDTDAACVVDRKQTKRAIIAIAAEPDADHPVTL